MSSKISYTILGCTGAYCLSHYSSRNLCLPHLCYGVITFNAFANVLREVSRRRYPLLEDITRLSKKMQALIPLSCFIGQLWIRIGFPYEFAYAHPVLSLFPFFAYKYDEKDWIEIILTLNTLSLIFTTFYRSNSCALAAGVLFLLSHGGIQTSEDFEGKYKMGTHNLCLALFCIISLIALGKRRL